MDNSLPIIRKKSNLMVKEQEKNNTVPPMIGCEKLMTNLQRITLMDILDQFAKDSESKSLIEILRSIFEIAEKPSKNQENTQTDHRSNNNYKDNQKFEFNDEQNIKNRKNGSDFQCTKQKDYRNRDQERGRDNDKYQYNEKYDRNDRQDRYDRNDRRVKYDNNDRNDRYERHDQHDKYQKYDKKDNYDRRDYCDKYANDNRGKRDYHKNDNYNETKGINNAWIVKIPDSIQNSSLINGRTDNFNQANLLSRATPK